LKWPSGLLQLLVAWFNAPIEEYLLLHAEELLTDDAEWVLEMLLARQSNWGVAQFRDLTRNARRVGIDESLRLFHAAEADGPQPA
jgi:hypothetical protein